MQAVEKVCYILPSTLTAQCKDLIETYGQAIIELLVQEADPKTVCTVLGLCSGASHTFIRECRVYIQLSAFVMFEVVVTHVSFSLWLSAVMEKTEFEAGGFCDVCKMAVRYVDGILEQNATEAEIEEAVQKVCNFLPEEFRTEVASSYELF